MPIVATGVTAHLGVFDMPTSVAFYRDLLGFVIINQTQPGDDFDWGMLRLGSADIMLNTAYDRGMRPAKPDAHRIAAHADTILYFACPDVDAVYDHVRASGIRAEPPSVAWYGMRQLYMNDPDGYTLCFQCPA